MRLIDADVLMETVGKSLRNNPHSNSRDRGTHEHEHNHFRVMIMQTPAVGAEPVRHGMWLAEIYNMETYETETVPFESWKHSNAYCSVCKAGALCNGHEEDVPSRYCPNCGAKMDGDVNGKDD